MPVLVEVGDLAAARTDENAKTLSSRFAT